MKNYNYEDLAWYEMVNPLIDTLNVKENKKWKRLFYLTMSNYTGF